MLANLITAIRVRRLKSHEVAERAGIEETRFSKGLNGRVKFSDEEQDYIARVMGAPENWLFAQDVAIPSTDGKEDLPKSAELSLAETILMSWRNDPSIREEFGSLAVFAGYMEAVERGAPPTREPGESKG